MTIDAAARTEVVDGVLKKLNEAYVFPEVAKKMEQAIRERVQKNEYDSVTSASKFAQTLTTRLQEVNF
jgi:retinol-binding protein 3